MQCDLTHNLCFIYVKSGVSSFHVGFAATVPRYRSARHTCLEEDTPHRSNYSPAAGVSVLTLLWLPFLCVPLHRWWISHNQKLFMLLFIDTYTALPCYEPVSCKGPAWPPLHTTNIILTRKPCQRGLCQRKPSWLQGHVVRLAAHSLYRLPLLCCFLVKKKCRQFSNSNMIVAK